jgi:hypothetical protein
MYIYATTIDVCMHVTTNDL